MYTTPVLFSHPKQVGTPHEMFRFYCDSRVAASEKFIIIRHENLRLGNIGDEGEVFQSLL